MYIKQVWIGPYVEKKIILAPHAQHPGCVPPGGGSLLGWRPVRLAPSGTHSAPYSSWQHSLPWRTTAPVLSRPRAPAANCPSSPRKTSACRRDDRCLARVCEFPCRTSSAPEATLHWKVNKRASTSPSPSVRQHADVATMTECRAATHWSATASCIGRAKKNS
jgi:hypothetical protein